MDRIKIFSIFIVANLIVMLCGLSLSNAIAQPERISVVYCRDCTPFQFQGEDSNPAGMIMDHWKLWAKKTGIKIDYQPASWEDTLAMMKVGKVDAHAGLFYNKTRDQYLSYGPALSKTDTHLFYHTSLVISKVQDALPFRIGVLSGDFVEGYLKKEFPELSVVGYSDYNSIMADLKNGSLRLFAADTLTGLNHLQKNNMVTQFQYKSNQPLYQNDWFAAVPEGRQAMLDVIENGMAKITPEEKNSIALHWTVSSGGHDPDTLIIAIDRSYPPFSLLGHDGKPAGLLVEMWRMWSKTTNTKISFLPVSWTQTIEALKTGEADIHSGLFKNKERESWMAFSKPIQKIDTAIYTLADGNQNFLSIDSLSGKRVAVQAGSFQKNYLKQNFPDITLVPLPDGESIVLSVLKRDADALIHEIPMVESDLERLHLKGALIRSKTPLFSNTVHAGVQKGKNNLIEIINKGFATIPIEQLAEIESRWISATTVAAITDTTPTEQEQFWISEHPVIKVANELDWAPFDYNEFGKPKGLAIDYIKLLAQKAGLQIEFIHGPSWDELLQQFKEKKIDVLPALYRNEQREVFTLYTQPYYKGKLGVFTHTESEKIASISELSGKRVGIQKSHGAIPIIQSQIPELHLLEYPSNDELVQMLGTQKLDAIIGNPLLFSHLAKENQISKIRLDNYIDMSPEEQQKVSFHVGVRSDYLLLHQILTKAMKRVTNAEMEAIEKRWHNVQLEKTYMSTRQEQLLKANLKLNKDEIQWLENHKTITYSEVNWKPLSIIENNSMTGVMGNYLNIVSEATGIEFKFIPSKTWPDVLDKFTKGEIDLVPGIGGSKEELALGLVSDPYAQYPMVIITNENIAYVRDLYDLKNKVFSLHKHARCNHLKNKLPDAKILKTDSIESSLRNVAQGKADVFLGHLVPTLYYISQMNAPNLKIAGNTDFKFRHHFLISDKYPELQSIVNKVFAKITEKERLKIFDEWVHTEVTQGFDYSILKWLWLILGVAIIIFFIIIAWNRRLGREISGRKAIELKFRAMSNASHDAMIMINSKGIVMFWNTAAERMFEYTNEEVMNKNMHSLFVPKEFRKSAHAGLKQFAKSGQGPVIGSVIEQNALKRNGELFPVEIAISSFQLENEWYAVGFVRDITDRKKIETQIKAARKELLLIFDSSQVGIIFTQNKGKIARVNRRMADILGYENPKSMIGISTRSLLLDDAHYQSFMSANNKLFLQGKKTQVEYELRKSDDSTIWCSLSGKAVDTNQPPDLEKGVIWVVEDITQRRQMEEEIRQSEESFRIIADYTYGWESWYNKNGALLWVNPAVERITGYSVKECHLQGSFPSSFVHPEDISIFTDIKKEAISGKEGNGVPFRIIHKTKEKEIWGEVSWNPVFDKQGQVTGYRTSVQNITDRKMAEEELQAKESRFRGYFENSLVGVAITHPDKGWIEVNDRFLRMLDYTRDELETLTWEDLSHPDELQADLDQYHRMLKGDISHYSLDKRLLRKDNSIIYTNIAISCVKNSQGEIKMFLGSYLDITDAKKTEAEMKQYVADLEKFNQITISREERMIDLKDEVNHLLLQLGKENKYKIR